MLDHSAFKTLPPEALDALARVLANTLAQVESERDRHRIIEAERARLALARERWILATAHVRARRAMRNRGIVRAIERGEPDKSIGARFRVHPRTVAKIGREAGIRPARMRPGSQAKGQELYP